MKRRPTEIIAELNPAHRTILEKVLKLEKSMIHLSDIEKNVAKERQAVERVQKIVDEVIKDED